MAEMWRGPEPAEFQVAQLTECRRCASHGRRTVSTGGVSDVCYLHQDFRTRLGAYLHLIFSSYTHIIRAAVCEGRDSWAQ